MSACGVGATLEAIIDGAINTLVVSIGKVGRTNSATSTRSTCNTIRNCTVTCASSIDKSVERVDAGNASHVIVTNLAVSWTNNALTGCVTHTVRHSCGGIASLAEVISRTNETVGIWTVIAGAVEESDSAVGASHVEECSGRARGAEIGS